MEKYIYHVIEEDYLMALKKSDKYIPKNYSSEGFIHCTQGVSTCQKVIKDYYWKALDHKKIAVLKIETDKVQAEVKFEEPKPLPGSGQEHLQDNVLFPHIYGPLNTDAVISYGYIQKENDNVIWPDVFIPLKSL